MAHDEPNEVPDHVVTDVTNNPGLVSRWVSDPGFRHGMLKAEDPAGYAADVDETFQLSPETVEWIRERVRALGADRLAGLEQPQIIAF